MRLRKPIPARGVRGAVVLAVGIASLAAMGSATAAPVSDSRSSGSPDAAQVRAGYTLRNANTGRCIDDSYAYGLRAFPCNGLTYQQWYGSNGAWKNVNTGRCIDDSTAYGLRAFPCNGLNYQRWWGTNGHWRNENTGRCIDDSYAYGLRAFGCNGLDYQRWTG